MSFRFQERLLIKQETWNPVPLPVIEGPEKTLNSDKWTVVPRWNPA